MARRVADSKEAVAVALTGTEVWLKAVYEVPLERLLDAIRGEVSEGLTVGGFKIEYREAPIREIEWEGREVSSDPIAFAHVWLRLQPTARGSGVSFSDELAARVLPSDFLPAIEAGVREALFSGPLAGYPVTDISVAVIDGSYHATDSTPEAFRRVGCNACSTALRKTSPILLEPIVTVTVHAPPVSVGNLIADLIRRRGLVSQMSALAESTALEATVPLSEMLGYRAYLEAATQGQATYVVRFSRYAPAPDLGGSDDDPAAMAARAA